MTTRTILLVDDDDDLRQILVEQLSLYEEFSLLQESNATRAMNPKAAEKSAKRNSRTIASRPATRRHSGKVRASASRSASSSMMRSEPAALEALTLQPVSPS